MTADPAPASKPASEPADGPAPPKRGAARFAGRAIALVVAAAFVALLTYGLISKSANTTIDDSLAKARPVDAPSLNLPVLERGDLPARAGSAVMRANTDGKISLAELRGRPLVLNFWASWCVPCKDESPTLEREWKAQRGSGVLFVGLNMQDLTEDARRFANSFGLSYLLLRDRGNGIARKYGVTGVPETFFVSPAGKITGHVIGVVNVAQLREGIAAARAGRTEASRRGGARRSTQDAPPPAQRPAL